MNDRPPILYKYLNAAGAEAFLKKPQIRFKDWRKLDDLMEVIPGSRVMTEDEIRCHARERYQQSDRRVSEEKHQIFVRELNKMSETAYWEREMRSHFDKLPALLFVSSMTERCDSGAMWALYAQEHQGIVFGVSTAIDRLRGTIGFLKQVTYSDHRPQNPFPMVSREILIEAITTKSTDWDYQREWRLVAGEEHVEFLKEGDVTEVMLGYKADKQIEALAMNLKSTGSRVFRSRPDSKSHAITRDEI